MTTLIGVLIGLAVSIGSLIIYVWGWHNGYKAAERELEMFTEGMRSIKD